MFITVIYVGSRCLLRYFINVFNQGVVGLYRQFHPCPSEPADSTPASLSNRNGQPRRLIHRWHGILIYAGKQ